MLSIVTLENIDAVIYVRRVTDIGLLVREPDGNRVYYKTNTSFPLYPELYGIMVKTSGLVPQISELLDIGFIRR